MVVFHVSTFILQLHREGGVFAVCRKTKCRGRRPRRPTVQCNELAGGAEEHARPYRRGVEGAAPYIQEETAPVADAVFTC